MKDLFMKKFNELDQLCKVTFVQETLDFKSLRVFADTLQPESKSLLLNIISIRNIVTHSKVALVTINKEAVEALEGFIEGLKRSVTYELAYKINPLVEKQKTMYIQHINEWIRNIEDHLGMIPGKKHTNYLYDCLREVIYSYTENDVYLYYNEAKLYNDKIK